MLLHCSSLQLMAVGNQTGKTFVWDLGVDDPKKSRYAWRLFYFVVVKISRARRYQDFSNLYMKQRCCAIWSCLRYRQLHGTLMNVGLVESSLVSVLGPWKHLEHVTSPNLTVHNYAPKEHCL